jgi:uncharacterized protein YeaO (DUF488 family)
MVLELQGKDKFKIDDLVFYKPEDLLSSEDNIKDKLVDLLLNPDSKLYIWLEFTHLKSNIKKWQNSGRHNIITLAYALDEMSPFAALEKKVYDLDGFKTFFAKHITDKDLISEMTTPNSTIITEADFWLKNYQNTSYLDVVISYFQKNIDHMNKKVCRKLCDYLIDVRLDIDDYWDNIKPLVDKAYSNGFISKNTIQKQKDFIVKEYESRIKISDYGKRKKIIEILRIIKPSHKMIKRFKKEEEVFDILKNSRLEEIEEEKEKRITEVKSDIEEQVFQNKLKAKNIARKNYIENNDTLLIVGVLVGAVVAIVLTVNDEGIFNKVMDVIFVIPIFSFIGGAIGYLIGLLIGPIVAGDIASNKVSITAEEQKDMDKRIEQIEKDIQDKMANLDNEIRKEIFKKTDEKIDEIFGNMG